MVWYAHLLKNFPQFIVIHTVKDFVIVNKTEIDFFFLEYSCIFDDPADVGNLISGLSALFNLLYIKIFSGFNSITGISILKSLKSTAIYSKSDFLQVTYDCFDILLVYQIHCKWQPVQTKI